MTLCDLLVVFGRQLRSRGNLSALVYTPDSGLQQAMQVYVVMCPGQCMCSSVVYTLGVCAGGGDRWR